MNIELRHLRYFIAVAEELHFGRAALRLRISQPPLSQQIQTLEEQIGARLLTRTNRSVRLTAAGEQFLHDARQILTQVDNAATRAARLHRGEAGELRMGFTSSAPFIKRISDSLLTFRKHYPAVHIQMREINPRQQIEPLMDGTLELGLMRNTPLPEALNWQPLLQEPLLALVPRAHPLAEKQAVSLQELAGQPFVFFDSQVGTGLYDDILSLLHRHGISPWINQEVGEAMTVIGLVATGLGVSLLPASFRQVRLNDVVWLPVTETDAVSEMWLVWPRYREQSATARQMMSLLLGEELSSHLR